MSQTPQRDERDPAEPFHQWQKAVGTLKAAEARHAPHAEIVRLAAEVIRARNAMTVDRMQSGWRPGDDILSRLVADDQLLNEADDSRYPPVAGSR